MKTTAILATTWASSNMGKIRVVAVGTLLLLGLLGVAAPHSQIAQAGPAIGGSHGCNC